MTIKTRVFLLSASAAIAAIILTAMGGAFIWNVQRDERALGTKFAIESAATVVAGLHARFEAGEFDEAEAQARAKTALKSLRFNDGAEYVFIWSGESIGVMHPIAERLVGFDGSVIKDANGVEIVNDLVAVGKAGGGFVEYQWPKPNDPDGPPVDKISYAAYFAPWDWMIGGGVYIDDLDADYARIMTVFLLVAVVVTALSFGFGFVVGRGVTGPLYELADAMRRLARGEDDAEVPCRDRTDEMGEMAEAVEAFKQSGVDRRRLEQAAAADAHAQAERGQRLESAVASFRSSIDHETSEVTAASEDILRQASSVVKRSDGGSVQSISVFQNAEHTVGRTNAVAAGAEELSASIREISQQVTRSTGVAKQAVDDVSETADQISRLAGAAQEIGEVVKLINDIAEQTNLLALNATIEAARAGEAGRGFAVVANEVKNLASQTASATEDISARVSAIQTETRSAVDAMGRTRSVIVQMDEISTAIAAAVEEQSAAANDISSNAGAVKNDMDEVVGDISDVLQGGYR
ncbi:MAG: cache domain-containing protein, partial [Pseudomonadota bacterium]